MNNYQAAPAAVVRAAAPGDTEVLRALRDGIELKEPVNIGKALRAHRLARPVLSGGTGPAAAVHLVNIGLTGWIYTEDTAKAYAKGFNDALKYYRHALLEVATTPAAEGAPPLTETAGEKGGVTKKRIPPPPQPPPPPPTRLVRDDRKPGSLSESTIDQGTVDKHLDAVLRASGSALRHYSMQKTLDEMRAAMRSAIRAGGAG